MWRPLFKDITLSVDAGVQRKMSAWITTHFGGEMEKAVLPVPAISKPNQLLLRVEDPEIEEFSVSSEMFFPSKGYWKKFGAAGPGFRGDALSVGLEGGKMAASVNPIDTVMRHGYGNRILSAIRQLRSYSLESPISLPFIGGRDCSGIVVQTGGNVRKFKKGDEVIAVIDAFSPGSHAEFVLAEESSCAPKPLSMSHIDAAAFPYAACTVWSALISMARINSSNAISQRVLIHGGAGGVGTTAIQMLRAWNVEKVVATCSEDCFNMVRQLGAVPIDYKSPLALENLVNEGPFDVILDCVGSELAEWSNKVMGLWRGCVHVSLVSPLLGDIDRYGIPLGVASTTAKLLLRAALPAVQRGQWFTYAYFAPHSECMEQLSDFLKDGKIKPVIDQVFKYEELPAAYEKVMKKKGRGKTIVDFNDMSKES